MIEFGGLLVPEILNISSRSVANKFITNYHQYEKIYGYFLSDICISCGENNSPHHRAAHASPLDINQWRKIWEDISGVVQLSPACFYTVCLLICVYYIFNSFYTLLPGVQFLINCEESFYNLIVQKYIQRVCTKGNIQIIQILLYNIFIYEDNFIEYIFLYFVRPDKIY